MPRARAIFAIAASLSCLALLASCADVSGAAVSRPQVASTAEVPREIRAQTADMAITRVEENVSPDEVASAVREIVRAAPACMPWPGVWLQDEGRRTQYLVRYDLMTRDWGVEIATNYQRRMQDFVELGFLTVQDRPEIGPDAVEYILTPSGTQHLRGSPYFGGARPAFCGPAERSFVSVTSMEWGQFPCGNLRVRFTHVADHVPEWARTQAARDRVDALAGAIGVERHGTVTLGRQWFRRGMEPAGMTQNGALQSLCYDASRQNIVGNDLELNAPAQ